MKFRNIVPSRLHHLVITFDDGRRTRLDISQWIDRQGGLIATFMQGRFTACGVEWPLGERLPGAMIRKMLDEQKSVIS
jgi:hypothetical protein